MQGEPQKNILFEERLGFSKNLTHFPLCVIGVDLFEQVTYRGGELLAPFLNVSNYFFEFLEKSINVPCLNRILPATTHPLQFYSKKYFRFFSNTSLFLREANHSSVVEDTIIEFQFKIKRCGYGEYFSLLNLQCSSCDPYFTSFFHDFLEPSSCESCAQKSFNCYGGFNLTPKANYWRVDESSTNFLKCPNKQGKEII